MKKRFLRLLVIAAIATTAVIVGMLRWSEYSLSKVFREGLAAAEKQDQNGISAAISKLEGASQFESHRHLLRGMSHWQRGEIKEALSD